MSLPSFAGISGTLSLAGSVPPSTTLSATTALNPPGGVPAPSGASGSGVAYSWLSFTNTLSLSALPTFTLTVPPSLLARERRPQAAASPLALEFFDPTDPGAGYQYAGSCAPSSPMVCGGAVAAYSFAGGQTYVFVVAGGAATPGPQPIALAPSTACTTPAANCLQFTSIGPTETFAASEPGYDGAFTMTLDGCAGIVSAVGSSTATPAVAGGSAAFQLASTGVGSCTVSVADARGTPVSAVLTVQVASVPIFIE